MPFYEYRCKNCHHELEVMQKISDSPLSDCPNCGKNGLDKIISAAGFQLKGTGWYVTDFRNSSKSKPDTTTKTEGTRESKSDPKPSKPD